METPEISEPVASQPDLPEMMTMAAPEPEATVVPEAAVVPEATVVPEDAQTVPQGPPEPQQPAAYAPPAGLHPSDERLWATLAHLSALVDFVVPMVGSVAAALLIYLIFKDRSRYVAFHSLQALIFQGAQTVIEVVVVGGIWVLGFVFSFLTLGIGTLLAVPVMILSMFMGFAISGGCLIYSIVAAVQANQGKDFRYVGAGDWAARILHETV